MKHEISILVISPSESLFNAVSNGVHDQGASIHVYRALNVAEAHTIMKCLEVSSEKLQIYLDSKSSKSDAQFFLRMLDKDYPAVSRRMVVLTDDASNISNIVSLACAECVGDVLNYPVSPGEVERTVKRQFPNFATSIPST